MEERKVLLEDSKVFDKYFYPGNAGVKKETQNKVLEILGDDFSTEGLDARIFIFQDKAEEFIAKYNELNKE